MTWNPRVFDDYLAALRLAFEEEISGEAYFARLSGFHSGRPAHALSLLARVETALISAVRPLILRHRIATADDGILRAAGRQEADTKAGMPWNQLVDEMVAGFPAFVTEFEQIENMAPPEDAALVRLFTLHEVAALDFARMEAAGNADSLAPLEAFLAEYGGQDPA